MIRMVGKISEIYVVLDVYMNDDPISVVGPLWVSLDQWNELREAYLNSSEDLLEVLTEAENEERRAMREDVQSTEGMER